MKTLTLVVAATFTLFSQAASAAPSARLLAEQAYTRGLFLQRTVGDLEGALGAFDKALEAAADAEDGSLVENVLLRRAECFRLLGRTGEQQTTIAALRDKTASKETVLGMARFFPAESDVVMQVDLKALLSSPLIKDLDIDGEIQLDNPDLKQMKSLLGFDPVRDIHRLTVGATLTDNEQMPAEHWLLLAEGRFGKFQPKEILESQKDQLANMAVRTRRIHGAEVYTAKIPVPEGGVNVMNVGLARLSDDQLLLGDLKAVKSFLAARVGKASGLRGNPRLSRLGTRIPAGSTFWLAAVPDQLMKKVKDVKNIPGIGNLPELHGVLVTAHFDKDLSATASAWTADNESARMLGDICRGLVALAQFVPTDEPLLQKLIKSLSVDSTDRAVSISVVLPGKLLIEHAKEEKAAKAAKAEKAEK